MGACVGLIVGAWVGLTVVGDDVVGAGEVVGSGECLVGGDDGAGEAVALLGVGAGLVVGTTDEVLAGVGAGLVVLLVGDVVGGAVIVGDGVMVGLSVTFVVLPKRARTTFICTALPSVWRAARRLNKSHGLKPCIIEVHC